MSAELLLAVATIVQAGILAALAVMHEKLRRRVTMLETTAGLHGQVLPYGAGRRPGSRT